MSRATMTLHTFCLFRGRHARMRSHHILQAPSSQTHHKMAMALLSLMRLRQRSAEHCHCSARHPSASMGKPSPRAQNQCPSSSMGKWSWFSTFSLLNYHLHNAGVLTFWIASRLPLLFSLPMDKRLN
jgi:hypothetical protein